MKPRPGVGSNRQGIGTAIGMGCHKAGYVGEDVESILYKLLMGFRVDTVASSTILYNVYSIYEFCLVLLTTMWKLSSKASSVVEVCWAGQGLAAPATPIFKDSPVVNVSDTGARKHPRGDNIQETPRIRNVSFFSVFSFVSVVLFELERWLEELWTWMLKFKDAVFSILWEVIQFEFYIFSAMGFGFNGLVYSGNALMAGMGGN
ncbi:hypothetical protein RHSIM_Rhsim04G0108500 [Rhododendron simsii]|uniref:Uncharacterized protein n=1 Tax=Rhododendron simsii TaxID=118357 RepID=A0A834H1L6_RHOSS|nr:hypothetical protein RHSIM_Rhsim04G0108500 [Rhododendron simsii]